MSETTQMNFPIKCPKCGSEAHPDDILRAIAMERMTWPCGRMLILTPVSLADGASPVTGEFGHHVCTKNQLDSVRAERDLFAKCLSLMGHAALFMCNTYYDGTEEQSLTPPEHMTEHAKHAWEALRYALDQCTTPNKDNIQYNVLHDCIAICGVWLPEQGEEEQSDENQ